MRVCVNGDNIHVYCGGPLWEKCVTIEFEGLLQGICSLIYIRVSWFLLQPTFLALGFHFFKVSTFSFSNFLFIFLFFGSCRLIWNSSLTISSRSYSATVAIVFFKSVVCEVGFCFLDQFLSWIIFFLFPFNLEKVLRIFRGERWGECLWWILKGRSIVASTVELI